MEQKSEQTQENTTNTESENSEIIAEQDAANDAEKSGDTNGAGENLTITELQATIKIEGQEFELESALAQDDKLLKTVLQPHFSSVENASITREIKNGRLHVTIVKKAQHKGR